MKAADVYGQNVAEQLGKRLESPKEGDDIDQEVDGEDLIETFQSPNICK